MFKYSTFVGTEEQPASIPIFGPNEDHFEKTASQLIILPAVTDFIKKLKPLPDCQYVLVSALGASEYYSSNVNGDAFSEEALIHCPEGWTGKPLIDIDLARDWPYGFPTFYGGNPFGYHRNKSSDLSYGGVELAVWNPHMKRVELVLRVEKDKCVSRGGSGIWDKLLQGVDVPVSMGAKVPWDRCSICTDMKLYKEALATFDKNKHKHPGIAVLEFHKKLKEKNGIGIRGIAPTRKDYCDHARSQMNKILPNGKKVWVDNDFPRFFDISFVIIQADKTAWTLAHIAKGGNKTHFFMGLSSDEAEKRGYDQRADMLLDVDSLDKTAADLSKQGAKNKYAEITKRVLPNPLAAKAAPIMGKSEKDLPDSIIRKIAEHKDLDKALSTAGSAGIILKPKEFQRVVLIRIGAEPLADDMHRCSCCFHHNDAKHKMDIGPHNIDGLLRRLLEPLMGIRSALNPHVDGRSVNIVLKDSREVEKKASSVQTPLFNTISAMYNGYREGLLSFLDNEEKLAEHHETEKSAGTYLFSPLSEAYYQYTFWDDIPGSELAAMPPWRRQPLQGPR